MPWDVPDARLPPRPTDQELMISADSAAELLKSQFGASFPAEAPMKKVDGAHSTHSDWTNEEVSVSKD